MRSAIAEFEFSKRLLQRFGAALALACAADLEPKGRQRRCVDRVTGLPKIIKLNSQTVRVNPLKGSFNHSH